MRVRLGIGRLLDLVRAQGKRSAQEKSIAMGKVITERLYNAVQSSCQAQSGFPAY